MNKNQAGSYWDRTGSKYLPSRADRLDSEQEFSGPTNAPTVGDFWSWAYSDFRDNAIRGVLGEFLVASALGINLTTRQSWDPWDLETSDGVRIEVKTSAYLQNWAQRLHSRISFSRLKSKSWDRQTGLYGSEPDYHAHIYVFCIQRSREHAIYDALDLNQWEFYVIHAEDLRKLGANSIAESTIRRLGFTPCSYFELSGLIESNSLLP